MFFLSHHYQNPADFSEKAMDESEIALERLYATLKRADDLRKEVKKDDKELRTILELFKMKWIEAMSDDFNTADALGNLFDFIRAVNRSIDSSGWTGALGEALEEIRRFGVVLGILELAPDDYLKRERLSKKSLEITEDEIQRLIEERTAARREKNWKRADEIRVYLDSKGITLEDTPKGTIWKVKS